MDKLPSQFTLGEWLLLYRESGGLFLVQFHWRGWLLVAHTDAWLPSAVILHHPDERAVGFWFEDLKFDYFGRHHVKIPA